MELAGVPQGEHLLGGLGQLTLGTAEDGHAMAGDGGATGNGEDGTVEWPDRVGGGHALCLARPATERWRRHVSK
jgi:hypothetical protein